MITFMNSYEMKLKYLGFMYLNVENVNFVCRVENAISYIWWYCNYFRQSNFILLFVNLHSFERTESISWKTETVCQFLYSFLNRITAFINNWNKIAENFLCPSWKKRESIFVRDGPGGRGNPPPQKSKKQYFPLNL